MGDILPPPSALALATQGCPAEAPSPGPPARPPREGFSPLPTGARGCRWDLAPCPGYAAPGPRWVLWVGDTGAAESIGWQPPPQSRHRGSQHRQTQCRDRRTRSASPASHRGPAQAGTGPGCRSRHTRASVGAHRSAALGGWGPHPLAPRRTMGWMGRSRPVLSCISHRLFRVRSVGRGDFVAPACPGEPQPCSIISGGKQERGPGRKTCWWCHAWMFVCPRGAGVVPTNRVAVTHGQREGLGPGAGAKLSLAGT